MRLSQEESSAFDHLVETWAKQLARSIQIFSGIETPTVSWSRIKDLPRGESESVFWWKQALQSTSKYTFWIGAHETAWNALGRASDDADPDDAKAAYLEILAKTQQTTASAINAALSEHLECRKGQVSTEPRSESLVYALVGVTISGDQPPAIILAVEQSLLSMLAAMGNFEEETAQFSQSGLMLDRLLNLEMPISVSLGKTQLPIRDLLKVVSGSVIELDQDVNDHADLIVHGTVVAKGEIVSVKGNYGIRIKEVISQKDRIDLHGLA